MAAKKKLTVKHLAKGKKLYLFQNYKHPIHMRGMVDGLFIYRYWVKEKKYWSYQVKEFWFFEFYYKNGRLTFK